MTLLPPAAAIVAEPAPENKPPPVPEMIAVPGPAVIVAEPDTLLATTSYPAGTDVVGEPVRISSCVEPCVVTSGEITPEEAVIDSVPAAARAFAICCATVRPP